MTAKQNQKFPFHFFFRFAAEGWGEEARGKCKEIFWFCTRESASVSEAHWFASPRNRSVRFNSEPPRAPRVRSGFAQRLIHHRQESHFEKSRLEYSAQSASAGYFSAILKAFLKSKTKVQSAMREFEPIFFRKSRILSGFSCSAYFSVWLASFRKATVITKC